MDSSKPLTPKDVEEAVSQLRRLAANTDSGFGALVLQSPHEDSGAGEVSGPVASSDRLGVAFMVGLATSSGKARRTHLMQSPIMRMTMALLLVAAMSWPGHAQASKKPATSAGPPLPFTMDFIVKNLNGLSATLVTDDTTSHPSRWTTAEQIQAVQATGCQITYSQAQLLHAVPIRPSPSHPAAVGAHRWRTTLLLSQLSPSVVVKRFVDPATTSVKPVQSVYALLLEATRFQQSTKESFDDPGIFADGRYDNFSRLNDATPTQSQPEPSKSFGFWFPDRDTAERVGKAFEHAIELCAGKKQ
jgi:hypothetical protein